MLNSHYATALPVFTQFSSLELVLVGCGGTGGFLAPALARLMVTLGEVNLPTQAVFVDPDIVEPRNIPRQNFVNPEVGLNKAEVLATRYSLAYGVKIGAIPHPFDSAMIEQRWRKLTVIIGAVDNAVARTEIANCLSTSHPYSDVVPSVWWLDTGNHGLGVPAGQVLLGSTPNFSPENAFNAVESPNVCLHLPSPAQQHPQLLQPLPEEGTDQNLSCAEVAALNSQSLFINQRVATEAVEMLSQLLLTKTLKRFATYFHAGVGSARSRYTDVLTLSEFFNS